jgi:hypothetical protein
MHLGDGCEGECEMTERQKMTAEEVKAILDRIWGPPIRPKAKVVTSDAEVVRDAVVQVAPADPNYRESDEGVVRVRRADFVTINMKAWEEQQWLKAEDRRHRRMIDPCRMGHWSGDED